MEAPRIIYFEPEVNKELTSNAPQLKSRDSNDRSAPFVEADVKVKASPMGALRTELKEKATEYHQAEAARDVFADVAKVPELKPTAEAADRSAPVIEAGVTIKAHPMADLKKEIASAQPDLKRVEEGSDRSAPKIDADVKLREAPMVALQKEILDKQGEITVFAATGGVKVVKEELMDEISTGGASEGLKHVEDGADRSAPLIEPGVMIKTNPMMDLKKEIASAQLDLKRVEEGSDRSAPNIEADVKIKPSPMPQLADEIKRHSFEIIEVN